MKNLDQYNGLPENYFIIDTASAPKEWPADEIDCAIARAGAVIELVRLFLNSDADKSLDLTLSNALWSALADVAHISKLAQHHNHEGLQSVARLADSLATVVQMFLSDEGQPAAYILNDCLEAVLARLYEASKLNSIAYTHRSKLSA